MRSINILAVDDEKYPLKSMEKELKIVFPNESIFTKSSGKEAITFVKEKVDAGEKIDYAFLDVEIGSINGIELGKSIKELCPKSKIIFCTAFSQYACESYQMHAIGYLLKPVMAKDIIEVLQAMDSEWLEAKKKKSENIYVQTFGNFEVFVNGKPIKFEREKSKEILAYLVDRKGAQVTIAELTGILFENKPCDRSTMNQTHTMLSSLKKSLANVGVDDLIIKSWKHIAVDISKLNCDMYELIKGSVLAINAYQGEYMSNYSWAEFTNANLANTFNKK